MKNLSFSVSFELEIEIYDFKYRQNGKKFSKRFIIEPNFIYRNKNKYKIIRSIKAKHIKRLNDNINQINDSTSYGRNQYTSSVSSPDRNLDENDFSCNFNWLTTSSLFNFLQTKLFIEPKM